jgi:hypothetical protein
MTEQQEDALLQITAQYVSELQTGQQPRLSEYLARYPQYAEAIADFVAYYHIAERQAPDDLTLTPSLSEASRSILKQLQVEEPSIASSALPTTLLLGPDNRRLTLSQIANKINLSTDIVFLLEHRSIDPTTIPDAVISRLAAVSGYTVGDIKLYLADAPMLNSGVSRRKQLKVAETGRYHMSAVNDNALPSFKQIVEASHTLTAEQKAFWLALPGQENL